jgi:hypothetical protein
VDGSTRLGIIARWRAQSGPPGGPNRQGRAWPNWKLRTADLSEENEDPQKQLDTIADIVAPPDQDEDDDLDDGEAADED